MKCHNHPDREAQGACVGCGNLFCPDCMTRIHGKSYCKKCIVEMAEKKDMEKSAPLPYQPQIIIQQNQQQQQQQQSQQSSYWGAAIAVCCVIIIILWLIGVAMGTHH